METIKSRVIKGDGLATSTGYPTANFSSRLIKRHGLKDGVYAAWATAMRRKYRAAFVCGVKDKKGRKKLEIFLIDYRKNLYGRYITLQIVKKVRNLIRFKNKKTLISRIKHDLMMIKGLLKNK